MVLYLQLDEIHTGSKGTYTIVHARTLNTLLELAFLICTLSLGDYKWFLKCCDLDYLDKLNKTVDARCRHVSFIKIIYLDKLNKTFDGRCCRHVSFMEIIYLD